MQIDLYWTTYAGKDPLEYFEKYPGRFVTWHVKDMAAGESREMIEVGSGIIDYKELFTHAHKAGMKEFFIEQDVIKGNGFESIKSSFDHISNII
jgi:sugar phosphate isomerase/epimerase